MNLEKLKDTARKFEQKEEWRKAIDVYLKAIQHTESGSETSPDLSLYNRVGDLYLKINDAAEAVRSYERAVDLYADQGFFNNAIALCGKILRVNPGRTQTYLKLCQLHARKNVVSEAKRNLIEFLERMNALGQLDQAFQAVKLFADQFSGSQEIRSMLVDLLRATSRGDQAREQLEKMAEDLEASGDKSGARKTRERLHGLDSDHGDHASPAEKPSPKRGDLIFLDTGIDFSTGPSRAPAPAPASRVAQEPPRTVREPEPPPVPEPELPRAPDPEPDPEPIMLQDTLVSEPEPTPEPVEDLIVDPLLGGNQSLGMGADSLLGLDVGGAAEADDSIEPLPDLTAPLGIQRDEPADLDFEPMTLEGMESSAISEFSPDSDSGLGLDDIMVSMTEPESDLSTATEAVMPDEPTLDSDELTVLGADALEGEDTLAGGAGALSEEPEPGAVEGSSEDALADLENRVLDDPENPDIHLELAEKLTAMGETGRVAEELELALAGFEDRQDWSRAANMIDRLVALMPDSIAYHQKRVELAYRMGDRAPLLEAYLGLGDALAKSGALDKAQAVYGRVVEHDPGNAQASAALARLGAIGNPPKGAPAAAPPPEVASPSPTTPAPKEMTRSASAPTSSSPLAAAAAKAVPAASPPPVSSPPPAPPQPSRPTAAASHDGGFVDLGSMLFDEESRPRDTRMRVNRREPKDQDEQREFHEILEQFKRGIDENLDSDDYQSHYDLGVAFKEMGLLDEAIGEFQKALRSKEGRLRTSEALGIAFFEKGQYVASEAVLRKAIESLDDSDESKIGLLYWLGRASEAQGKDAEAVRNYERAMIVDIRFMDLSQRMQRLSGGRRR
jgi:tetratricopeptide (TPR) repeat protein